MSATNSSRLEVHEHAYPSGGQPSFKHSHTDGDTTHKHPETGPACYTIDKDDWVRATGLKGGGRKQFTNKPNGLQLARVELESWQRTFTVVVPEDAEQREDGPAGGSAVARMVLGFDMAPTYEVSS